jgi:ATP-dependent HslUV protease ATP-binding subunit HslU
MDASLQLVKELKIEQFRDDIKPAVEDKVRPPFRDPQSPNHPPHPVLPSPPIQCLQIVKALCGAGAAEETQASFLQLLRDGALEDREVTVEVPVKDASSPSSSGSASMRGGAGGGGPGGPGGGGPGDVDIAISSMGSPGIATVDIGEIMQRLAGGSGAGGGRGGAGSRIPTVERRVKVREARTALEEVEIDRRLSQLDLRREAVVLAEQNGIVFIDEIDKLVSNRSKHSGDASSEGVQRDLLPLIEGTTVEVRRFGNVRTDYMLFVASGAFHEHKPSELLPELQGRLPIRVELKGLEAKDLERILTETKFSMLEQQKALLGAEGVSLEFEPEAVTEIARLAAEVNRAVENIGARRLHTVIERIMEDISYNATDMVSEAKKKAAAAAGGLDAAASSGAAKVVVDKALVQKKLLPMLERSDFSKFIL